MGLYYSWREIVWIYDTDVKLLKLPQTVGHLLLTVHTEWEQQLMISLAEAQK